uniref:Cytochrome c oxidase subunit 3 n=1 Tax=Microcosmus sulcatus TaxID=341086 RepID=D2YVH2_9ASCI|nr:cytochrome c oxidase subunit III [Microcosmus sulcatus]CAL23095.2 cytochrome c oxidase subunit III [Microcosmus sulcatus]
MLRKHPFHLVDASPWPVLAASGALCMAMGLLVWFHNKVVSYLIFSVALTSYISYLWWRDIAREGSYLGFHLLNVQRGLRIGMGLFITSEVFFFLGFFWTFFHSGLATTSELGYSWPPMGMDVLDPMAVPLLNTVVLLSSGVTVTYSHYSLVQGSFWDSVVGLGFTLVLGVFFTLLQLMEYFEAPFTISDSVYGSIFFMATGFHGFHVIVGSIFLAICLLRMIEGQLLGDHHVGYECAIWYWHFVDVVWVFLYISIYWWGSV